MIVELIRDILGLVALSAVSYGLWLVHPAAAFIGTGSIILAGLVLLRR